MAGEGEHGGDVGGLAADTRARDALAEGLGFGEGDAGVGSDGAVQKDEAAGVEGGHGPFHVGGVRAIYIVVNDEHLGVEEICAVQLLAQSFEDAGEVVDTFPANCWDQYEEVG